MIDELSKVGIALIYLPKLKGLSVKGITFYLGNKIVIGLVKNNNENNDLVYGLYHELGHIVLKHIDKEYSESLEKETDKFAKKYLSTIDDA